MNDDIAKLSDKMLVEKLVALSKKETEVTADILLHLIELDKRKLYRDLGYPSLFAYCINRLRYSPGAAKRRLVAARCIADYPEVYEMFLRKDVSLTTISIFAPVLTEENKQQILSQVSQQSPAEVEWVVGRYNPSRPSWDRIVPIVIPRLANLNKEITEAPIVEAKNLEFDLGSREPKLHCRESKNTQAVLEKGYRFEFSTSKTFKVKLDKVKTLVSGKLVPGASLEKVMELLMDDYIDRHSPEKREERRRARKEKQARVAGTPWKRRARASNNRRRIPAGIRDNVFLRDGFKCTYVSADGVRCNATTGLHLDHILPHARGGPNSTENLRILCGSHNRLVAEQEFGRGFMDRFYGHMIR